jgi:acyl-CoA reductase-like NAD-dependent aldehyde dehydrogenase
MWFPVGVSVTGEAISTHPKIRKIAFTGSTETGKGHNEKSCRYMLKTSL